MAGKIQKLLARLTSKERALLKLLLLRILQADTDGLDIKRLSGHRDLFRVRKGHLRVVYRTRGGNVLIVRIDRRNEKTYKQL